MPIKLRRTNPDTGVVQWRNLASLKLKVGTQWRNINKALLKVGSDWRIIFGSSGPTIDFPLEITSSSTSWK